MVGVGVRAWVVSVVRLRVKRGGKRWCALFRARLDLDGTRGVLDKVDLGLARDDAGARGGSAAAALGVEREAREAGDGRAEVLTVKVKDEGLSDRDDEAVVGALEDGLELVGRVLCAGRGVLLEPERDLEVEGGEVDVGSEGLGVKGLDVDDVAALAQSDKLADEAGGADCALGDGRVEEGGVEEGALDADVGDAVPVVLVDDDAVGEGVGGARGLYDAEAAALRVSVSLSGCGCSWRCRGCRLAVRGRGLGGAAGLVLVRVRVALLRLVVLVGGARVRGRDGGMARGRGGLVGGLRLRV